MATDHFYVQALLLSKVVTRILEKRAEIRLSRKPNFALKPIVEFTQRIRITGLEKFQRKTYVGVVNFYRNEADFENHKAVGAIVLYVPEDYMVRLLSDLQYPVFDEDDEETLLDGIGAFCNIISGNFKAGLTQLGYPELYMSFFRTYQNSVVDGVEYSPEQKFVYEIDFEIKGKKCIVIDLTMGELPVVLS